MMLAAATLPEVIAGAQSMCTAVNYSGLEYEFSKVEKKTISYCIRINLVTAQKHNVF
jgi:hypothetical protein